MRGGRSLEDLRSLGIFIYLNVDKKSFQIRGEVVIGGEIYCIALILVQVILYYCALTLYKKLRQNIKYFGRFGGGQTDRPTDRPTDGHCNI